MTPDAARRLLAPAGTTALHRRFFLAGIAATLTAGATWGAVLLVRIAAAGSFTSLSIFEVNAHGQAQIYGWVGLFVMGFAYTALPRLVGTDLPHPRLAAASFPLMLGGIALRAAAEPFGAASAGAGALAVAGACLELAAVALFVALGFQVLSRARGRARGRVPTPALYVGAALAWFLFGGLFDLFHLLGLLAAPGREALLRQVATYQFALRNVQIHGLALMMIFGVSLWVAPALFGTRPPGERLARRLWLPLQLAVAAQVACFVTFMRTLDMAWGGALWLADLALALAAALFVWNLGLLRRRPRPEGDAAAPRGLAFLRAAHGWLLVSLAMLVAAPLWGAATGAGFSHAWYGAMRHAITVGFVSLTIMGMAARVVPALHGLAADRLPALWAPFVLLNLGCALRVSMQAATDLVPAAFPAAGVSGLLEVAALALWGAHLASILLGRRRAHRLPAPDDGAKTALTGGAHVPGADYC